MSTGSIHINSMLLIPVALVLCVIAFTSNATEHQPARQVLSFGIVPQQSASKMAGLWTPILDYIGEQTGYRIHFKTAQNIPAFEQRLTAGEYDLSYMNPYHYTVFNRKPGYLAFAKARDKRIKGIIVVRKDSPYQLLDNLRNRNLAFPSPAAFAASILPRVQFKNMGIAIKPAYVSSHDSVYRSVAKGLYPAGGGVIRTFKSVDPEIRARLRILWTTKSYTPHAIAAHPRISPKVVQQIQKAMLAMDKHPHGRGLLASIRIKGFEAAEDEDWDDVRSLKIELLDKLLH